MSALRLKGASLNDLGIDFILPGYPEVLLKPCGDQIELTVDNLEEYLALITRVTLLDSVRPSMTAFRRGFNTVFPIDDLMKFEPFELDALLCGAMEAWDPIVIRTAIKADHGYTLERYLYSVFVYSL